MWARASGPDRLDDVPSHLGVDVWVGAVEDRDGHARIALDRPELRAMDLRVDQHVVVVCVDPHHVGHRRPGAKQNAERGEVRRLGERLDP